MGGKTQAAAASGGMRVRTARAGQQCRQNHGRHVETRDGGGDASIEYDAIRKRRCVVRAVSVAFVRSPAC